jgi:thiol:disulfide interchange protein
MLQKYFLLFLASFFCVQSFAQNMKKVHLTSCVSFISDKEAEIIITAKIDKGWHLYSFEPGGDGMLIAPEIKFSKTKEVEFVGKVTEQGNLIDEDIKGVGVVHYFKNEVNYKQKISFEKKVKIKASVYYQTCDESACLPPITEDLAVDMNVSCKGKTPVTIVKSADSTTQKIEKSDSQAIVVNIDTNQQDTASAIALAGEKSYGSFGKPVGDCGEVQKSELSIWTALFYGILGGFAALFFPCTLPMIPMTISFFLKGAGDKKQGVRKGILYGFFIFLVYFLLSLPFLFLGWGGNALNSFSTNVWVNLVFFIVFIVFAFSLFGFYDISLPSGLTNKIDSKSGIGSASGIFFMALTLAIVSFSCTGPILGLVLGNVSNSKLIPPAMAGFGLGLGIPFALFAMFPNLLKALPKSGGWLTVLKVVFGFIELAFALKFLSNADLVKQWGLLKREVFVALWIIVCVCMALYLIGKLKLKEDPTFKSSMPMKVLACLSILFAGYLSLDFFGKDISLVSGFPPPKFYSLFHKEEKLAKGSNERVHHLKGLNIYLYLEDALAEGKKQGKPVMIDFTGWACVNCRKMEENVWTIPKINNLLNEKYIIASLYVDEQIELPANEKFESTYLDKKKATTIGDKWFDLSLRDFKSATQPFYALVDPINHRVLNTPKGYIPAEDDYAKFLECGIANFKFLHP